MHTTDFDYTLPQSSIAQSSVEPRDHARLMLVDRKKKTIAHKHFFDIADMLQCGDVVVWNNSKVFKARLFGRLLSSDGRVLRDHTKPVELFLVRPMENTGVWKVLARPGRHVRMGTRVQVAKDFYCDVILKERDGTLLVQFPDDADTVRDKANRYGHIPVPPYVKDEPHEIESYQTVYAKHEGSVAAPTAGFHFTRGLIQTLKDKGVVFVEITLHVGLGTFLPVKSELVADHTMHSEFVEVSEETAEAINRAKQEGRRVVAVGTTTVRTLEGVAGLQTTDYRQQTTDELGYFQSIKTVDGRPLSVVHPYRGDINLFILPGFEFRVVDVMITNFHLPKSTLLMLVCAFAGDTSRMLEWYHTAVTEQYRFYSFGDAMMIR